MKVFKITLFSLMTLGIGLLQSCGDDEIINAVVAAFSADQTSILEGESISFSSTSNLNVDTWAWEFEGGMPSTSSSQNPTVTYETAGTYKVKLTVSSNNSSDELEETGFIVVDDFLHVTASFSADEEHIKEGETVTFTSLTNDNVDSWSWTFTGGTPSTSTAQNPTVTFDNAGDYDVSLTVTSAHDEETITMSDFIGVRSTVNSRSMTFDGDDEYIHVGGLASPNDVNAFSISLWIKTSGGSNKVILSAQHAADYYIKTSNTGGLSVGIEGWDITGGVSFADNAWHHLVIVWDAGVMKRYFDNGTPFISTTNKTALTFTSIFARIGGDGQANSSMNGSLAEVSFWNKALSDDDVNTLYNNCQLLSSETGLSGYWNFNTTSTSVLNVINNNLGGFHRDGWFAIPVTSTDVPLTCQ